MYSVILASGFATRLHPLTKEQSKALLPVNGEPLLSHVVKMIPREIPVIVTTNKVFEQDFITWSKNSPRAVTLEVEDIWSIKDCPGPIGSLERVIRKWKIKEPILVLACDNYFTQSLSDFISHFDGENTLIGACYVDDLEEASWHGIPSLGPESRVYYFAEKPIPSPDILVSPMCYIFPTSVLPLISNKDLLSRAPEGKMPRAGDFIAYLVDNMKPVYAYHFEENWKHLTSIKSYYNMKGGEQKR